MGTIHRRCFQGVISDDTPDEASVEEVHSVYEQGSSSALLVRGPSLVRAQTSLAADLHALLKPALAYRFDGRLAKESSSRLTLTDTHLCTTGWLSSASLASTVVVVVEIAMRRTTDNGQLRQPSASHYHYPGETCADRPLVDGPRVQWRARRRLCAGCPIQHRRLLGNGRAWLKQSPREWPMRRG